VGAVSITFADKTQFFFRLPSSFGCERSFPALYARASFGSGPAAILVESPTNCVYEYAAIRALFEVCDRTRRQLPLNQLVVG